MQRFHKEQLTKIINAIDGRKDDNIEVLSSGHQSAPCTRVRDCNSERLTPQQVVVSIFQLTRYQLGTRYFARQEAAGNPHRANGVAI